MEQLIQIENSSYDSGALDVFDLIAMLRHARVYVAVEYDEILGAVYFMRNFDNPDKVFLHSINIIDPQAYPNLGTSLFNIAFADMRAFGIRLKSKSTSIPPITVRSKFTGNSWFVASDSMQSEILGGEEILMLQKNCKAIQKAAVMRLFLSAVVWRCF